MAHNFNDLKLSYDVLQPIKAPVDPHRDVAILIDIGDTPEHEINLSGSDLDNVKKSEFDLVDLFQNIYVTPQHIKKERDDEIDFFRTGESSSSSSSITCNPSNATRGYEGLGKEVKTEKTYPYSVITEQDVKRVLKVPTVISKCDFDGPQKINKSTVNSIGKQDYDCTKAENVMSGNIRMGFGNVNSYKTLNETSFTDRLLNKTENNEILGNIGYFKSLNGICTSDGLYNKTILEDSKTLSGAGIGLFNNNMPPKPTSIDYNRKCIQINNKKPNITMTITLDKKTYTKQRQTKNEIEKIGYTKAPDLSEKSVILPQIMQRLDERRSLQVEFRKKEIESKTTSQCQCTKLESKLSEVNKVQDKVVQGNSKATPLNSVGLSPVIALENCNRERLVAHRVHSAFLKYVLTGSYY